MNSPKNFLRLQAAREINGNYGRIIQERFHATHDFINRLGLLAELDSHNGCVNCLEWSEDGKVLASGSDDCHISIWEPFRKKHLVHLPTGHQGNIFTVKFLPNNENRVVITGAADHAVRVHDVVAKELMRVCTCHTNRVKRAVVDPNIPYLYWSAGEDGMVIQHDMRENHICSTERKRPKNVMVDLRNYLGGKAEAKCLAIDPVRSEYFAVGANDPYVRIYDRRMIKLSSESSKPEIPFNAVQYFVPGHLPPKIGEYKRKYRSLASTFVSYSPDGRELLVNLGGEQIYIFPVAGDLPKGVTCLTIPQDIFTDFKSHGQNGFSNGYKNGTSVSPNGSNGSVSKLKSLSKVSLPSFVEDIKLKANEAFQNKKFAKAVQLYNEALKMCPDSPILRANRAAALIKRNWDGDIYAALKDCQLSLKNDEDHFKAHMRMCRCLFELKRFPETQECLNVFKFRFPNQAKEAVTSLENDLTKAAAEPPPTGRRNSENGGSSSGSSSSRSSREPQTRRNFLIRFQRSSSERSNSNDEGGNTSPTRREESEPIVSLEEADSRSSAEAAGGESGGDSETDNRQAVKDDSSPSAKSSKGVPSLVEKYLYEKEYKDQAVDYRSRFCGHCNTTTDIKEANFFGDFVVAGSDDGSFFIWDRETTNIVKIIKGDDSIVNCLQPHPDYCCLATSGIESVVRIWTPMPEGSQDGDRIVKDVQDAAYANQRRMNSNPFEVILMNMGYRVNGEEEASDEEASQDGVPMQCNPT